MRTQNRNKATWTATEVLGWIIRRKDPDKSRSNSELHSAASIIELLFDDDGEFRRVSDEMLCTPKEAIDDLNCKIERNEISVFGAALSEEHCREINSYELTGLQVQPLQNVITDSRHRTKFDRISFYADEVKRAWNAKCLGPRDESRRSGEKAAENYFVALAKSGVNPHRTAKAAQQHAKKVFRISDRASQRAWINGTKGLFSQPGRKKS